MCCFMPGCVLLLPDKFLRGGDDNILRCVGVVLRCVGVVLRCVVHCVV